MAYSIKVSSKSFRIINCHVSYGFCWAVCEMAQQHASLRYIKLSRKQLTRSNSIKSSSSLDPLAPPIFSLINCLTQNGNQSHTSSVENKNASCPRWQKWDPTRESPTWFALLICFLNPAKDMMAFLWYFYFLIVDTQNVIRTGKTDVN